MDWFLILVSCISVVILFVVSLYFLVYYQHPDDKNEAWLPKITVLLGMMLAGATVLLLPLDVANNEGYPGKLALLLILNKVHRRYWKFCEPTFSPH
jgi:LMBR1 domain-containing protein 1